MSLKFYESKTFSTRNSTYTPLIKKINCYSRGVYRNFLQHDIEHEMKRKCFYWQI